MTPRVSSWTGYLWPTALLSLFVVAMVGMHLWFNPSPPWQGAGPANGVPAASMANGTATMNDGAQWAAPQEASAEGDPMFLLLGVLGLAGWLLAGMGWLLYARARRDGARLSTALAAERDGNLRKSRYVATVAHELRTPLNGMIGFSELIGMADDLPEAKLHAGYIHSSSLYLQNLVNNILDLSKIEAGRLRPDVRVCRPAAVLEHAASIFGSIARRKGLDFEVIYPEDRNLTMRTDPDLLERAMINLISNAIKYTEKGRVTCELRRVGQGWYFSVQDTGRGIDAQRLQHIFEPFNTLNDPGACPAGNSSGLGLSLTHEVAVLLGAKMSVSSDLGKGSTFTLSLQDRDAP